VQICGRNVLDPEDAAQQAEHLEQCVARHERLQARHASADVEVRHVIMREACFQLAD